MNFRRSLSVVALAVAAFGLVHVRAVGADQQKPPDMRIGIVNAERVLSETPEYQQKSQEYMEERKKLFDVGNAKNPKQYQAEIEKRRPQIVEAQAKWDKIREDFIHESEDKIRKAADQVMQDKHLSFVLMNAPWYPESLRQYGAVDITTDVLLAMKSREVTLSSIAADAQLGPDVVVSPYVVVGSLSHIGARTRLGVGVYIGVRVRIGADCVLQPGVVVLDGCELGDGVTVGSGSVVGTDGFGYVEDGGRHHKIPQVGSVAIGNQVQLGAGVCIDRATTGATRVGDGTSLGDQVQLGHNVQIGANCTLMSQVGIAGSTEVDHDVVIEPQAGLQQHIHIGAGARIGPRAGVIKDVPPGAHYTGFPARPEDETAQIQQALAQLPQWFRENFKNQTPAAQEPPPFSER